MTSKQVISGAMLIAVVFAMYGAPKSENQQCRTCIAKWNGSAVNAGSVLRTGWARF